MNDNTQTQAASVLNARIAQRITQPLDVNSELKHFALINYALPRERLAHHIPEALFEIPEFEIGGQKRAMMSVVPFWDAQFHFIQWPWFQFAFGQTNYRAYVIHRATGQHAVWFFGTTLGSWIAHIPKLAWKLPWHRAHYHLDCRYSETLKRYQRFHYAIESKWATAHIDIEDSGQPSPLHEGFSEMAMMQLILTHPIDGYYRRTDGTLGRYSVWHDIIKTTQGSARNLYFSVCETLGLLSAAEMQKPHSVMLCPKTQFIVHLPPQALKNPAQ